MSLELLPWRQGQGLVTRIVGRSGAGGGIHAGVGLGEKMGEFVSVHDE
jgi:hypothetical protein